MMPAFSDAKERHHWYKNFSTPSIGVAHPHVEVTVLDEHGRPCDRGERGELVVRGTVIMREYAGQPDATNDALRHGWFRTGDEATWEPSATGERLLLASGRLKELIVRGGQNLAPGLRDRVLGTHKTVRFGLAAAYAKRAHRV